MKGRILIASGGVLMAIAMVFYPQESLKGALQGLTVWWDVVFPALLPFFILSDLLMALGVMGFLGRFMEPIMRPLFHLPGQAAFVVAVGFTSGFPIGAVLTARLVEKGILTPREGEHLVSFTNNSSPLFMLGAVAVGFFQSAAVGTLLALSHYAANLTVGLLFPRLRKGASTHRAASATLPPPESNQPLGVILGDAVKRSVTTLTNVGGFIIFFAVVLQLLSAFGVIETAAFLLTPILKGLGLPAAAATSLLYGFFEITLGSKAASQTAAPLFQQLALVLLILGWSGLSIQAQVASIISPRMRISPFLISRLAQGLISVGYLALLFPLLPVLSVFTNSLPPVNWLAHPWLISLLCVFGLLLLLILMTTAGLWHWKRRLRW